LHLPATPKYLGVDATSIGRSRNVRIGSNSSK
jgi:hypothetical protein